MILKEIYEKVSRLTFSVAMLSSKEPQKSVVANGKNTSRSLYHTQPESTQVRIDLLLEWLPGEVSSSRTQLKQNCDNPIV